MSEKNGLEAMLAAYQADGGTVNELCEEYQERPSGVLFLAGQFDVTAQEMDTLVEVNDRLEALIQEQDGGELADLSGLSRKDWVKAVAQELVDYRRELREQPSTVDLEEPNSERFPEILEVYREGGGDAKEFNTLQPFQLIKLGVDPQVFVEELGRQLWAEGPGGDFEDLTDEEKEAVKKAAIFRVKGAARTI